MFVSHEHLWDTVDRWLTLLDQEASQFLVGLLPSSISRHIQCHVGFAAPFKATRRSFLGVFSHHRTVGWSAGPQVRPSLTSQLLAPAQMDASTRRYPKSVSDPRGWWIYFSIFQMSSYRKIGISMIL